MEEQEAILGYEFWKRKKETKNTCFESKKSELEFIEWEKGLRDFCSQVVSSFLRHPLTPLIEKINLGLKF